MPGSPHLFLVTAPTDDATVAFVTEVISTVRDFLADVPSVLVAGVECSASVDKAGIERQLSRNDGNAVAWVPDGAILELEKAFFFYNVKVIKLHGAEAAAEGRAWSEGEERVWNHSESGVVYNEVAIAKAIADTKNAAVRTLLAAISAHGKLPNVGNTSDLAWLWDEKLRLEELERLRKLEEERLRREAAEKKAKDEAERARHAAVVVVSGLPFAGKTAIVEALVSANPTLLFTVSKSASADIEFGAVEKQAADEGKVALVELSNFGEVVTLSCAEEPAVKYDALFDEEAAEQPNYTRFTVDGMTKEPYFIEVTAAGIKKRLLAVVAPGDGEEEAAAGEPSEEQVAQAAAYVERQEELAATLKETGFNGKNMRSWGRVKNDLLAEAVDSTWAHIVRWYPHLEQLKEEADKAAAEAAAAAAAAEAEAAAAAAEDADGGEEAKE